MQILAITFTIWRRKADLAKNPHIALTSLSRSLTAPGRRNFLTETQWNQWLVKKAFAMAAANA
jgi:hypothetical protein